MTEFHQKEKEIKQLKSNLNKEGNEESEKLKSIIISIYLCYYMRIVDGGTRSTFESQLKTKFNTLVNNNLNKVLDTIDELNNKIFL